MPICCRHTLIGRVRVRLTRRNEPKEAGTASALFPSKQARAVPLRIRRRARKGKWRAMKHQNSHLLVDTGVVCAKGAMCPDQTDIGSARAIKRLLSYTFILDCENPARRSIASRARRCASASASSLKAPASSRIGKRNPVCPCHRCCVRRSSCASRFVFLPSPPPPTMAWSEAGNNSHTRKLQWRRAGALFRPGADAERPHAASGPGHRL